MGILDFEISGIWCSGYLRIKFQDSQRELENLVIWESAIREFWILGILELRNLKIWIPEVLKFLDMCNFGNLGIWVLQNLGIRQLGNSGFLKFENLETGEFEY